MRHGTFAGAVMLDGLDDYIAPSAACVRPLIQSRPGAPAQDAAPATGGAALTLELEGGSAAPAPALIRPSQHQTAQVSLNDCLACSGCVTTAEAVLVQQQSADQLRDAIASKVRAGRFLMARACTRSPALSAARVP